MKSIAWIALTGVALIVAGCAKPEPSKPGDGGKKAAPAADKDKKAPTSPEKATTVAPSPATKVVGEEPPLPVEKPAATPAKEGKGGSVTGAMGKALLKAMGGAGKTSPEKATDVAPPLK